MKQVKGTTVLLEGRALPRIELPREHFELSCGAKLIVSPRAGAPVTAVRVHVRGGPSLDPPGKEGLAFLTGTLADQGTRTRTEAELAGLLEPAGGEISGDANGLSGTIAGGSWKLLVELISDVLQNPIYPEAEIEQQRKRLLSRLIVRRDDPQAQGARRFRKLVYGEHWLGRPSFGDIPSVESITRADLLASHAERYKGKRTVIAVCGDVKPRAVKNLFERLLAEWDPGTPFTPEPSLFPERASRVDVFGAARQQVHLFLGHLGIPRKHPDYPALVVMDHVLGTGPGFTNRISKRLRDEQGLAYSVNADIHSSAGLLPGTFTAYIGTSPEHVGTAIAGFIEEIGRIQDKKVGKRELEVAKNYLVGSFVLGFERASRRAGYLVASELHGFPDDNLERMPRAFAATTSVDVRRVAREHLFPNECCLAGAGPTTREELAQALEASRV